MPYIDKSARLRLKDGKATPLDAGELNYCITQLVISYLSNVGVSYGTLNAAVGALECAKQELYRRVAVDYENKKIAQNGDVFPAFFR